jgi:hypothetical protein
MDNLFNHLKGTNNEEEREAKVKEIMSIDTDKFLYNILASDNLKLYDPDKNNIEDVDNATLKDIQDIIDSLDKDILESKKNLCISTVLLDNLKYNIIDIEQRMGDEEEDDSTAEAFNNVLFSSKESLITVNEEIQQIIMDIATMQSTAASLKLLMNKRAESKVDLDV